MDRVETRLHEGIQCLPRESFLLVDIGRMRSDLVFCQAPNSLPQRFVLLIESEQMKDWLRGYTLVSADDELTASLARGRCRESSYTTVVSAGINMEIRARQAAGARMDGGPWSREFPV